MQKTQMVEAERVEVAVVGKKFRGSGSGRGTSGPSLTLVLVLGKRITPSGPLASDLFPERPTLKVDAPRLCLVSKFR